MSSLSAEAAGLPWGTIVRVLWAMAVAGVGALHG